jgi:hypothetical protein
MSDIQSSTTQQLTQALNQLSKLAPQSEAARLGIEVIVKHLSGSILNLSSPGNLQNRNVSLPARNLQGQLQNAGTYTVKVAAQENPILQFFSTASAAEKVKIPLTSPQLQALLKLPANQIISPILSKDQGNSSPPKGNAPLLLNAKIESLVNNQLLVKVIGQNQALPIQLPVGSAAKFKAKDTLQIELSPKGSKWQAKITSTAALIDKPGNFASNKGSPEQVQLRTVQQLDKSLEGSVQRPTLQTLKTRSIVIPPEQAPALLKAALMTSMSVSNLSKTASVQLPVKTVLSQLANKQSENVASLLNKLNNLSGENVTLSATRAGHFELHGSRSKPVAQLPVSKHISAILGQIKTSRNSPQTVVENTKLGAQTLTTPPSSANVASAVLNPKSAEAHIVRTASEHRSGSSVESAPISKAAENLSSRATTVTRAASSADNLSATVKIPPESSANKSISGTQQNVISSPKTLNNPLPAEKPRYSAELSPTVSVQTKVSGESKAEIVINSPERSSVPTSKPEQIKLIQTLLRVVNARAELPAETLNRIQLAVTDPLFSKESSLKELIDPLVQQIKQAIPQGKDTDAVQIRQLLGAPALNLSALQVLSPPAGQGLLGGLVALLQISLASRLLRNQPSQLESITQTLDSFTTGANKAPSSAQTARGLADFFQLEQKHQLLKEIGRLLSGHQANKLTNAEQAIQGQDTFYYTLPSAFDDKLKNIELLIRRESESQQEKSEDQADVSSWHLTMKLSVGELGELLTKAKLRPDHLEIDFYASNDSTKEQVFNFLPLLKKRLESLGIEVAKSQCQLGKIPSTLQQRPYQVFETKV